MLLCIFNGMEKSIEGGGTINIQLQFIAWINGCFTYPHQEFYEILLLLCQNVRIHFRDVTFWNWPVFNFTYALP